MATFSNALNIPSLVDTAVVGTGTGFSTVGYTPVNTGGYLALRDANGNCSFNTVIETTTTTVASGQTIAMTYGSSQVQVTSGTTFVNFNLPDSTTLILGWTFVFNNIGSGINNIYLHDGTTLLTTVLGGGYCLVTCDSNSTTNGVWKFYNTLANGCLSGTLGTTVPGFLAANTIIPAYTTTATAASTTTLTVVSTEQQYFTGTTTQTVILPVTSTLVNGQSFTIVNNSSGSVTVQSSGANTIQVMAANTQLIVTVVNTTITTAAAWNAIYLGIAPPAVTINIQQFSTAGTFTYTPTVGMTQCTVQVIGGGGGGGAAQACVGVQSAAGSGGGGAGYAVRTITAALIGASQTVTVGAAGVGGVYGSVTPGNGGVSSVGSLISASGGYGGYNGAATGTAIFLPGGSGGDGLGGDYLGYGSSGMSALSLGTLMINSGGEGGQSIYGGSCVAVQINNPGNQGSYFGGGGGGASVAGTNATQNGGAAGIGLVIITEYI